MRVITTSVTVYRFDELTERAQETAVDTIQGNLSGDWWDSFDNDDIGETMLYTLAHKLGFPEPDMFKGAAIGEWDLGRSEYITVSGTLTRDNAPALPWVDGIEYVQLTERRQSTEVEAVDAEPDCTCSHGGWSSEHETGCPSSTPPQVTDDQREALREAVTDAIHAAWRAGHDEMEYKGSEERARESIEANGWEFLEDGKLYG